MGGAVSSRGNDCGYRSWRVAKGDAPSVPPTLRQRLEVADRAARGEGGGGRDDGVGVDAVVAIEVGDRAGLPEMLDPERAHAVAVDGAEPGERGGMAVEH